MTSYLVLLGLLGLVIGATVIAVQLHRRRMFSMLTFAAAVFVIECAGGSLKALMPEAFVEYLALNPDKVLPWMPAALVMYIIGFLLFLYGYCIVAWLLRVGRQHRDTVTERYFTRVWTPSYRVLLVGVTLVALFAGFVQQYQRVRAAGSLSAFLATAYRHRWGTGTTDATETALVVIANLVSISAVAFAVLWIIAWLRGRLTLFEKLGVTFFLLLLFLRQWSTMYRASLIFGALSLFAASAAERRLRVKPLIIAALILGSLFVGVNFLHLYMYHLTAGWREPSLFESVSGFLAPHGHLYSLASIIRAAREETPLLDGRGMVESLFFFVPRSIWAAKLASGTYGTVLVQAWSGLPTHYQVAITTVGEFFAHFGYLGVGLMVVFGMLYGLFDSFAERSVELRAALFGILLTRVLADTGMGLSAISITLFCTVLYLLLVLFARSGSAFYDWVMRGTRRFLRLPAAQST